MNEMNVLTLNGEQYEIADKKARHNMASAVAVTMTGTAVSTDMVSPIEHEVECRVESKNLWNENAEPYKKNQFLKYDGGSTYSFISDSEDDVYKIILEPGTHTITFNVAFPAPSFAILNSSGEFLFGRSQNKEKVITFTAPAGTAYGLFTFDKKDKGVGRLNRGPVSIAHTPYIPDLSAVTVTRDRHDGKDAQTYTVNSDGSANGPVKSLYPDMRITVSNSGAVAVSTYNADTKKYIDSKFTELQALALDLKGGM